MQHGHCDQGMLDRGLVPRLSQSVPNDLTSFDRVLRWVPLAACPPVSSILSLVRDSYLARTGRRIPILRGCGKEFPPELVRERILAPAAVVA